jgi:membrane protease YdiL (CAAX protease family)
MTDAMTDVTQSRGATWRRIWSFIALVAVFTLLATYLITHVAMPHRLQFTLITWVPGLCAIGVKLAFDRSLKGLGLGRSGGLWLLAGLLIPLAYALPVYIPVWLTGHGGFDPHRWGAAIPYLGDPGNVWIALGLLLTAGLVDKLSRALGEEIGWRGFLVPEVMKLMPLWSAGLFTGVIWTLWHLPAILFAGYNSGGTPLAYQIGCFAAMVIPSGILYAWLRTVSGSVWPCAMLHAAHNLFIQSILDQATVNGPSTLWITGEFGFGLALATIAAVLVLLAWRKPRNLVLGRA